MLPLLPLLLGAVTGATLVRLVQKSDSQKYVRQAGATLRNATAAGLESIEHSSARLRQKLQQETQGEGTVSPQVTTSPVLESRDETAAL